MKNDYSISSTRFYYFMCFYSLFYDYYQTFPLFSLLSLSSSWLTLSYVLDWIEVTELHSASTSIRYDFRIWFYRWQCNEFVATGTRIFCCCRVFSYWIYVILPFRSIDFNFFFFIFIIRCSPFNVSSIWFSIWRVNVRRFFFFSSPHQCDTGNWNYLLEYSWNERYVSVIKMLR